MFQNNFSISITQRSRSDSNDFNEMTLNAFRAQVPDNIFTYIERWDSDSAFQFQGHWSYANSNSTTNPTLGNAAPRENRFWRYSLYTQLFKFVTIGKFGDGTDAVDECAELYLAEAYNRTGIRPAGGKDTANGFILQASAFFRKGHVDWESSPYFFAAPAMNPNTIAPEM